MLLFYSFIQFFAHLAANLFAPLVIDLRVNCKGGTGLCVSGFCPIAADPAVCSMSISRRPVILGGKWNETMEEQTMKYGVIDVGGGLRGIYGAGVLDRCLEEDLRFDLCIGVSAGSANMASYLAGQHGRNKPFYDEYSFRREYMSCLLYTSDAADE